MPFELNIGDAPLTHEQQRTSHRCNLGPYQGFCRYLTDTWGSAMSSSIAYQQLQTNQFYLPHRQIPVQLQSEVRKCLDNWLKQGIMHLSKSPYASQVVIVRKKTSEIRLCVDFRTLNAISIHDSFPLPCVEEALQAVQATVWFSSFDLAQGYLQNGHGGRGYIKNSPIRG